MDIGPDLVPHTLCDADDCPLRLRVAGVISCQEGFCLLGHWGILFI